MRYIKLFESLFSRDDTDKGKHSDWRGWLHTTVRRDNYECIEKYCGIDSADINNVLTDFLDEYPEFNFECAFYYNMGNLFTIYIYRDESLTLDIEGYPKIREFAEDVNSKFGNYGLQSKFAFSPIGNPGVTNRLTNLSGPPRCCRFVVSKLDPKSEEEIPQKGKKWWNIFEKKIIDRI